MLLTHQTRFSQAVSMHIKLRKLYRWHTGGVDPSWLGLTCVCMLSQYIYNRIYSAIPYQQWTPYTVHVTIIITSIERSDIKVLSVRVQMLIIWMGQWSIDRITSQIWLDSYVCYVLRYTWNKPHSQWMYESSWIWHWWLGFSRRFTSPFKLLSLHTVLKVVQYVKPR